MNFTDNEVSLIIYHTNRYGAHRFFQGSASKIPNIEMMTKERDKALYHYNQLLKILKLE